jgi:ABC-type transport system substrate-binding protein
MTLYINQGNADPTGWDAMMTSNLGAAAQWGNPYMEWLLTGDIATYGLGPGADGAFAFNLYEGVPEQYFGGELATGWTVQLTPVLTYTWTIRQGVMFTGNSNIGMAPRALTAADVVYSEQRAMSRPGFAAAFSWLSSTQATGNYTVVWTCSSFYTNWTWRLGGTALGQILQAGLSPEVFKVIDQVAGFFSGVGGRYHQRFQFHFQQFLLPLVFPIRE